MWSKFGLAGGTEGSNPLSPSGESVSLPVRLHGAGRAGPCLRHHDPQEPGLGISRRGRRLSRRDGCGRGGHRTRWRDQWGYWHWSDCMPDGGSLRRLRARGRTIRPRFGAAPLHHGVFSSAPTIDRSVASSNPTARLPATGLNHARLLRCYYHSTMTSPYIHGCGVHI
jgi:hypothetical protein